ncbi:hypothetical protein AGMMS49975_18640 [Clostridia bacterium]|nr:hypothetical protein AGMMS49975_18640 [Clostridia bacterium]
MDKNPTDFRNIGQEIAQLYESAELYILSDIATRISMGENIDENNWRYRIMRSQKETMRQVKALMGDMEAEVNLNIEKSMKLVYYDGFKSDKEVFKKLKRTPSQMPLTMVALISDTKNSLNAVNSRILRRVNDFFRQAQAETSANALAKGLTINQAAQQMVNQLAKKGLTGFVDAANRQWDASSYAEMAMRTNAAHAYREGFFDSMAVSGNNLVYISKHVGTCEKCAPWEGEILIDGDAQKRVQNLKDAGYTVDNETGEAIINKEFYNTLAENKNIGYTERGDRFLLNQKDIDSASVGKVRLSMVESETLAKDLGVPISTAKYAISSSNELVLEGNPIDKEKSREIARAINIVTSEKIGTDIKGAYGTGKIDTDDDPNIKLLFDKLSKCKNNSVMIVHNHNNATPLSEQDFETLLNNKAIKINMNIDTDGNIYAIEKNIGEVYNTKEIVARYKELEYTFLKELGKSKIPAKLTMRERRELIRTMYTEVINIVSSEYDLKWRTWLR